MSDRRSYEAFLAAIVADPENDELRLQFASFWRAHDAALAQLIETQVARIQRQRVYDEPDRPSKRLEEDALLQAHEGRWAREVAKLTQGHEFHRGFISYVVVDPYLFLERGSELLNLSPIRHVGFGLPVRGLRFPLDELLASPLLSRLDSINLEDLHLGDGDLEKIASCAQLENCLSLELSYNPLTFSGFRALAASPYLRKLLHAYRNGGTKHDYTPAQQLITAEEDDPWRSPGWEWAPLGEDGQALEREFGYIPWLHPQDNACDRFDARWLVDQGRLPKRPFGSPVS